MKKNKLHINIPNELHRALELYKLDNGMNKTEVVIKLLMESKELEQYLNKK